MQKMSKVLEDPVILYSEKFQLAFRELMKNLGELKKQKDELLQFHEKYLRVKSAYDYRQRSESMRCMAGAMVHSLNNHLAVVLGNLEMVMEDTRFNEDASESINEAAQAARKLEELSSKILLFLGQPVGKLEPTDLARFCLQHVEKIDCITPKNIILETKLPCSITPIKMDKMLMEQALNNLIENALEAIGNKEGVITLSVTVVSIFNIGEMSCFPEDWEPDHSCYACLEVCDNGCGVEPGDIKKIFEPFFTRKFIGRGLGLSAVLGIVVAHDGAVCVQSNPRQGTIFRLLLPLIAIDAL